MRHTRKTCNHNAERHTVGPSYSRRKSVEATSMWAGDAGTSDYHLEVAISSQHRKCLFLRTC